MSRQVLCVVDGLQDLPMGLIMLNIASASLRGILELISDHEKSQMCRYNTSGDGGLTVIES